MANKTIFQLPASGALVSTDELEKQLTAGGASQKLTLAQLLTFIQNNATAFSLGVAFAQGASMAAGKITFVADGSATFATNGLNIATNGSVSIGGGALTFDATTGGAIFGNANAQINGDGSALFSGGVVDINAAGDISNATAFNFFATGAGNVSNGVITFSADGDLAITDSAKGLVLRSPIGNNFRIKVDDAGNLGTEAA